MTKKPHGTGQPPGKGGEAGDEFMGHRVAAFFHSAVMRHLMMADPAERDQIIERVKGIHTRKAAIAYIEEVRGHYHKFREARKKERQGRGFAMRRGHRPAGDHPVEGKHPDD